MKSVSNKVNFPQLEQDILSFWKQQTIFKKTLDRSNAEEFVFYDGPPFATGLPHYGHLLAGTIKDVIPRYKTMRGFRVERRFGWDCHGLPVEFEMEQTLKLAGRHEIEAFGVAKFNEACRDIVLRYTEQWQSTVERMGRWVDFENDYKTMDRPFMESVWWVFKTLWEKGLIYEGRKVVPYSWRVATPLSNFEANLNYKDVQDPSVTVRFQVIDESTFFLAWTTTPWTLPSNLALCVGPDLDYVQLLETSTQTTYYLGKNRIDAYFEEGTYSILKTLKGSDLVGKHYLPLFDFARTEVSDSVAWVVLQDTYVSEDSGTGIVHQAPAFGEDDLRICTQAGIPLFDPVDDEGNFLPLIDFVAGKNIKEADKIILKRLKDEGKLFRHETLQHSYPFCWRTDTPLIYKAISTWFLKVEAIKESLIANNQQVHWVPDHLQEGRFGKWLNNARDWAISRNRFWGTPLPIWKSDAGDLLCFGSVAELESMVGHPIADIHKHFVDSLVIHHQGVEYHRIPEVLDCWFESGSMPYAQQHYPFENKEHFEANFPAHFISEGLDQTRGWFYTLMVISTALFQKPAFQNVIVNGLLLAEDGKKMSKRLKNYPNPHEMINQYGADAIRLYMLDSAAVRAEDLRFAEKGLLDVVRSTLLPLWNALSFFTTYAEIDQWDPIDIPQQPSTHVLDRWILSQLHRLVETIVTHMDRYELNRSVAPLVGFIDTLTNWYIRRSRRRFWKSDQNEDKQQAYATLYQVLFQLSHVLAPFIPFLAEALYQQLRCPNDPESVHLCQFPSSQPQFRQLDLEQQMDSVLSIVNMGRSLRSKHQLKIRQPLPRITLIGSQWKTENTSDEMILLIQDELNVKEVLFSQNEGDLVHLSIKPNFKKFGPQLGPQIKDLATKLASLSAEQIQQFQHEKIVTIDLNGVPLTLAMDDVLWQRTEKEGLLVMTENQLTIALETQLTPELIQEGLAREFINKVQFTRKEHDFEVVDRIQIYYQASPLVTNALTQFGPMIQQETLADVLVEGIPNYLPPHEWDLNGETCCISIEKQRLSTTSS